MKKSYEKLLVLVLLVIFLGLNLMSAQKESLTYDEPFHIAAGLKEWRTRDFSSDPYQPPLIREIAVLPLLFSSNPAPLPARVMIILLGLILGYLIYWYSCRTFGSFVGVTALFLYVFEPTFLAHSHYVTLDIGASLFFFLAYLTFLNNSFFWGLFSGLALVAKTNILPTLVISYFSLIFLKIRKFNRQSYLKEILVSILVIWAVYFFTWVPLIAQREDSTRVSEIIVSRFPQLTDLLVWLKKTPLPLGNFLAIIKNSLILNIYRYKTEFLGKMYPANRWYFLPTIFILKTPIPLLILLFLGIIKGKRRFYLLLPVIILLLCLSFSQLNPRLRYLLPVYPFMIIVAAIGAKSLYKIKFGKIILGILAIWYLSAVIFSWPHFISFANELTGPKSQRPFLFSDANYDWGQGLYDLKNYLMANPVQMELSYFGTDQPENYGLSADKPFGEKFEDRCQFNLLKSDKKLQKVYAISLTNYYYCGYYQKEQFAKEKVSAIVGESILIFK